MFNMIFGYTRVSTRSQDQGRQYMILNEFADRRKLQYDQIYVDKDQSNNFDREAYQKMRSRLRPGDIVVITELSRLGRDYSEIVKEYAALVELGVDLHLLDLPLVEDIADPLIKKMVHDIVIRIFSFQAQREKENIRSRVKEGLKKAKLNGTKLGRPSLQLPKNFDRYYERWKDDEITVTEWAKILRKSRAQVYRYINYYEDGRREQEQLNIEGQWVPVVEGEHKAKKYGKLKE